MGMWRNAVARVRKEQREKERKSGTIKWPVEETPEKTKARSWQKHLGAIIETQDALIEDALRVGEAQKLHTLLLRRLAGLISVAPDDGSEWIRKGLLLGSLGRSMPLGQAMQAAKNMEREERMDEPRWPVGTRVRSTTWGGGLVLDGYVAARDYGFQQRDGWSTYILIDRPGPMDMSIVEKDGNVLGITNTSTGWTVESEPGGTTVDRRGEEAAQRRYTDLKATLRIVEASIRDHEGAMAKTGFWDDADKAQQISTQHAALSNDRRRIRGEMDRLTEEYLYIT